MPLKSYAGVWAVNTTAPTLRDTFTDPDGDKVNGTFQVRTNAFDGTHYLGGPRGIRLHLPHVGHGGLLGRHRRVPGLRQQR
ncbi:hypothetical protein [Streptomyces sp. WG-D5]